MIPRHENSPLMTEYSNASLKRFGFSSLCTFDSLYEGAKTMRELDGARRTEALAEDRFIAAITGASTSEIFG